MYIVQCITLLYCVTQCINAKPMKEMKMFATILTGSLVPPPPPPGPMVRQQNPPSPKSKSHTHVLMGEKQAPLQVTKSWFGTGIEPLDFRQGSNIRHMEVEDSTEAPHF